MGNVPAQQNPFKTEFEKGWEIFEDYFLGLMRKLNVYVDAEFYLFFSTHGKNEASYFMPYG